MAHRHLPPQMQEITLRPSTNRSMAWIFVEIFRQFFPIFWRSDKVVFAFSGFVHPIFPYFWRSNISHYEFWEWTTIVVRTQKKIEIGQQLCPILEKWSGRRPISNKVENPKKKSGNSGPTPLERGWLRGWNHGKLVNNFSHESDVTSLLPTASTTPYFRRSSDPSANFFARPSARTFPFLFDFDLREIFFRRPPSLVLFFGRLQFRHFLDNFNTVWPSGDLYHNLHIFSSGWFLLGPYSPPQIWFVMWAYWFLFPCSIFFCVY